MCPQTTTVNGDGSRSTSYAASGPTFACNLQPMNGDEVPAPLALLNLKIYKVFMPYDTVPVAKNRMLIDGVTYEIQDVRNPRSPGMISNQAFLSRLV